MTDSGKNKVYSSLSVWTKLDSECIKDLCTTGKGMNHIERDVVFMAVEFGAISYLRPKQ